MAAMSGGVDSSVAAALLMESGYTVSGVTLKLFENEDVGLDGIRHPCCSLADIEDARSVAGRLGINHSVINLGMEFRRDVIIPFAESYKRGQTPNPCINCNKYIKFGELLKRAVEGGYDYIATGHYAKVEYDARLGRYLLKKAADISKDQTYMLYTLTQEQLAHTLFPLGGMQKSEVRRFAALHGFVNARKHDSQDICFVKKGGYTDFLQNIMGVQSPPGNFVDPRGSVVGRHRGLICYTVGQRKGLGLNAGIPQYVIEKDSASNTVTVGGRDELFFTGMEVGGLNMISVEAVTRQMRAAVKTRYGQHEAAAALSPSAGGKVLVTFDTPQPAITPGQAAVFYDGDVVIGGGTIIKGIRGKM